MPGLTLRQEIVVEFLPAICMLNEEHRRLIERAVIARESAQAPYSHYTVGAALLSKDYDDVFCGCNVERADYSGTTHAEQAAIDAMVLAKHRSIRVIAIAAAPESVAFSFLVSGVMPDNLSIRSMVPPCGGCLGKIWENCFGDRRVTILSVTPEGGVFRTTIGDIFPASFDLSGVYD